MTHLLAHLLTLFAWRSTARKTSSQSFIGATGDVQFELDLQSDGDDAVQLEHSDDEGFSLHGNQMNFEICGNNQKAKKQLHCYNCINDIKCAEKDAKAQGKDALLCFRKTKKI